ncbi:MAG TPA: J domain-containing protein [Acidimicrobiales bacterium]|nr:J domain-containing protein [Acidimicrobiales bacterium]
MAERDLYEVLGVARDASDDELKRAYRKKARELHPDTNPDDPEAEAEFKQVTVAYEVLCDPERRRQYDLFGLQGLLGGQGGPEWQNFAEGGLGDLFEAFFGAMGATRRGTGGPGPGPDAEVVLRLTLAEAAFGAERALEVRLPVACEACGATGASPGTTVTRCADCQGTGEQRRVRQSILGQMVTSTPCARCQGAGSTIASPCEQCRGEGRTTTTSTLVVDVPAGVEDGSTMRLSGRGPAGFRGGPSGTLFVHLGVEHDARFERHGDDLHTVATISVAQAALGATVPVATLEGDETVDVERGTQPGTVLRLRQRGVTHLRGRGRGDLLVHVAVTVPTELDEASDALLRQLAAHRGEEVAEPHVGLLSRLRSRR